jgi:hypothetical protein
VLQHIRQRVAEALVKASTVTLSTYGPADIQAGVFACEAAGVTLYLLVPRTSDHLFNLENNPIVVATTETWQLRGTARVVEQRPIGLALLDRPDASWCELVEMRPTRMQIRRSEGEGYAETFDID